MRFQSTKNATPPPMFQGRLFRKYALYLTGLLSVALLVSGLIGVYFSYRDTRAMVEELQREKARVAAIRIEQFIQTAEAHLRGALPVATVDATQTDEPEYLELLKLLRLAPAITNAAWINAAGRERVVVSRVTRDVVGSNIDRSDELAFRGATDKGVWRGSVFFNRGSEPYVGTAVADSGRSTGVVVAEINLKFVQDVVSAIRSGTAGHAYLVDAQGRLISHPDMSLVLKLSDWSAQPHVAAALERNGSDEAPVQSLIAKNQSGVWTLTAYAPIEVLGWKIFLEQPLSEALAPLIGSVLRAGLVLLLGIGLAIAASRMLARQMVAPIRTLEAGVARLAAGQLDEPVVVKTGDELEGLADEFNLMARQLKESYASLEQKIEVRTHQLSEANSAKSRFLASASHDLRQPVHALGLFVAQLEEAEDPVARQHIAGKIAASSTAVSDLLEALLDVSKLDTDAALPRHIDFPLQTMFDRLEHSFAVTAQAKGLRLRVRPTLACVTSDPVLLERILLNLLSNAIRYTRIGGVLIGARCHGERVAIEVWDTGVGIAPDEYRHIFEEFYRLPGVAGEDGKGLGLGLAIVERLALRLQVTVGLTSVKGRGSKFSVIVPRASGAAVEVPPPELRAQPIRLNGMHVALIDDDDTARDAAQGLLEQWGCSVVASASGQQYLRTLDEGASSPALIICDYRLGESELGTNVIALIRERLRADIPAVIVSGDVTPTLREDAASSGLHLLYKPLKAAKLRALLHHVYVSADAP